MTDGFVFVGVKPFEHVDFTHVGGWRRGNAVIPASEWREGVFAVVV